MGRTRCVYTPRSAMHPISEHFDAYAAHHTSRGNRLCHLIGLPFLGVSMVGLLSHVPVGADLGLAFLALLAGAYVILEWRLAILFVLASPPVWLAGRLLPWQAHVMLLGIGVVVPFAGHVLLEKAGPRSLWDGFLGTLFGPLWFLNLFARI